MKYVSIYFIGILGLFAMVPSLAFFLHGLIAYAVLMGSVTAAGAVATVYATHKLAQLSRRVSYFCFDLCGYCGYDLTGNVSGTCPECGRVTVK